jgi:hypothetical protein
LATFDVGKYQPKEIEDFMQGEKPSLYTISFIVPNSKQELYKMVLFHNSHALLHIF